MEIALWKKTEFWRNDQLVQGYSSIYSESEVQTKFDLTPGKVLYIHMTYLS